MSVYVFFYEFRNACTTLATAAIWPFSPLDFLLASHDIPLIQPFASLADYFGSFST
jgi:hypothetical protein